MTRNELKNLWFSIPKQDNKKEIKAIVVDVKSGFYKITTDVVGYYSSSSHYIGENVLGHANLGKGVIEVALGGYACDGNFQLFDVETVEIIMTHELGHGIGLSHTTDPDSIMYPMIKETKYSYCLLDV